MEGNNIMILVTQHNCFITLCSLSSKSMFAQFTCQTRRIILYGVNKLLTTKYVSMLLNKFQDFDK